MSAAAKARRSKEAHPERYCSWHGCLWREVKDPGAERPLRFPCPRHTRRPSALPSVEEMARRYGTPQPQIPDYVTPTHYLVYDVESGTVLIPREWYDGREAEIEAAR